MTQLSPVRQLKRPRRPARPGSETVAAKAGPDEVEARSEERFEQLVEDHDRDDRLLPFHSPMLLVRWVTTILCLSQSSDLLVDGDRPALVAMALVLMVSIIRSVWPSRDQGRLTDGIELGAELSAIMTAVLLTGGWTSTFLFAAAGTLTMVGFARGVIGATKIGAAGAAVLVAHAVLVLEPSDLDLRVVLYWICIFVLTAGVAGYARQIFGTAVAKGSGSEIARLADANSLLSRLHTVALTLPASLEIDDVLDTTVGRLRSLLAVDGVGILRFDSPDEDWTVMRRQALAIGSSVSPDDAPSPARRAIRSNRVVVVDDLSTDGPGFNPGSGSAIYAPLAAHGQVFGLLVVERASVGAFTAREGELLGAFADPVGLAIDNAQWFSRIQLVSAEAERSRIARDLHDRIGQALAYLAFELDGLIRKQEKGEPVDTALVQLRQDLRGVVSEVRETLYDLRTDVDDGKDIAVTIDEFAERLAARAGLDIELELERTHRIPLLQEREMWRVAQEALTNVERHAMASEATVVWRCNGRTALLEVSDNGKGIPEFGAGRSDSFGILGMRERASSIGAELEIHSQVGQGTTVRCVLKIK